MARLHMHDDVNNVVRRIKQADSQMMLRELVANALDATGHLSQEEVRITLTRNEDDKLVIFNNGHGMSADQLEETLLNIGKSGQEKIAGIHGNFGQGARLTILKSYQGSEAAAVYVSCKGGRVSQACLGWDNGVPGMVAWDETGALVIDVTDEVWEDTGSDWTKVVLLGHHDEHATADRLIGESSENPQVHYLAESINQRFFRFNGRINIDAYRNDDKKFNQRHVAGLGDIEFEQSELVELPNGDVIRYGWLSKEYDRKYRGRVQRGLCNHGCLVYQGGLYDEIYSARYREEWTKASSRFGLPLVGKQACVQVILARSEFLICDDQRRNVNICEPDGSLTQITFDDYEDVISENVPDWLLRNVEEAAASSTKDRSKHFDKRIKRLEQQYSQPVGVDDGHEGKGRSRANRKPRTRICPKCMKKTCVCERCQSCNRKEHQCICGRTDNGPNTPRKRKPDDHESGKSADPRPLSAPDCIWIDSRHDQFPSVDGFLASWEGDYLYLNIDHESISDAVGRLMRGRDRVVKPSVLTMVKEQIAEEAVRIIFNSQRLRDAEWTMHAVRKACSKLALTAVLADPIRLEIICNRAVSQKHGAVR